MLDEPADEPLEEEGEELAGPRRWRRWLAIVAAVAVLAVPVWNVVEGLQPQFADNGLEVCTFDYCQVEAVVEEQGQGLEMARLAQERLGDDQAQAYADRLAEVVDGPAVTVEIFDSLPGDIGGRYIEDESLIQIERPASRWIVLHEVAHSVGGGHGTAFEQALLSLLEWAADD